MSRVNLFGSAVMLITGSLALSACTPPDPLETRQGRQAVKDVQPFVNEIEATRVRTGKYPATQREFILPYEWPGYDITLKQNRTYVWLSSPEYIEVNRVETPDAKWNIFYSFSDTDGASLRMLDYRADHRSPACIWTSLTKKWICPYGM